MSLSRNSAIGYLIAIVMASAAIKLCVGSLALVGNFSSYQTIFGMIAKRYESNAFSNIWRPEFFAMESGRPNMELIFFPLVSLLAGALHAVFGGNLDFWGRFVSVAATSANTFLVYRIARCRFGRLESLLAAFIFTFSPYVWVYGRNFQNEALALLLLSSSLYAVMRYMTGKGKGWVLLLSAACLGASGALRLHFLFVAPAFLLFFSAKIPWTEKVFWMAVVLILPVAWHLHNWQMQNTHPNVHSTMFMQLQMGKTFPHPFLLKPFYYVHVLKNLVAWAVGPAGFFFVLWAIAWSVKEKSLRSWIVLSAFSWATVVLIPDKILVQHFYGYAASLPLSVLAGVSLARFAQNKSPRLIWIAIPTVFLSSLVVAHRPAYHVSATEMAVFPAAKFIREKIPMEDLVIASHGASGDLQYYGDHLGWPFSISPHTGRALSVDIAVRIRGGPSQEKFEERNNAYRNSVNWLEYLRGQGAKYFVVSERKTLEENPALKNHVDAHYTLISKPGDPFYAYRLQDKNSAP